MLAAIKAGVLAELVWVSLIAGVAITATYSFLVLSSSRSAAARRAGQAGVAVAYGALAVLCLAVFAAGLALAVRIMLTKA